MRNIDIIKKAIDLLSGKWIIAIVCCIIIMIIQSAFQIIDKNLAFLNIFLAGPIGLGAAKYFLKIVRGEQEVIEDIFYGFQRFVPALVASVIMAILIVLGMILLIVPGVILATGLAQVYFVMLDEPELSAVDALKKSWAMMDGYKMKYFLLCLIFIGMFILGLLALVVGIFVVVPIMYTSTALFYEKLKARELLKV